MLHKPPANSGEDYASEYKTGLGVKMFLLYGVLYLGFVAVNVIKPVLMETVVIFGLNLAVVYGFVLIVVALALALIYNRLCAAREKELRSAAEQGGNH